MTEVSKTARDPLFDVVKALMMVWVFWGRLGFLRLCLAR